MLGIVGLRNFLIIFFSGKNIILCILKGILPFKMHDIIFFSRKGEKILGFTSKFRQGRVSHLFLIWHYHYGVSCH